ncbi:RNA polymerase Rpb4 [Candidatus Bathyarchaeota archaeon]|nr:RNA polymerase Rpb4 [Candidatus Bathyarchaeota archaeon]MBS7630219.1 RNA polymerase Rpb4 [Candidatus Bathyarchaeota archaeon]
MSVLEKKDITLAEVKRILEAKEENLDPLQRRVLDYVSKFSKLEYDNSIKMVEELTQDNMLEKSVAVQIVNCLPSTLEELRVFLGRQKIISEEDLNKIMKIVAKYAPK